MVDDEIIALLKKALNNSTFSDINHVFYQGDRYCVGCHRDILIPHANNCWVPEMADLVEQLMNKKEDHEIT